MSTLKVDTLKNGSSGAIDFPQNLKIGGNGVIQGYTSSASEPSSPATGDYWWDSANEKLYRYINGEFKELTVSVAAIGYGDRGFSIGGVSARTQIDYWDMTTSGNSADFGDLTTTVQRIPMAGGATIFAIKAANVESFNPTTLGNASSYCDLNLTGCSDGTAESNGTIVIHCAGTRTGSSNANDISQFSATAGTTATDFGDLTVGRAFAASCSNGTRFVQMGGTTGSDSNVIDYVDYETVGNATDFGDLTSARSYLAGTGTGAGDRGLTMGGGSSNNTTIDYITVSSPGNAADFGDLAVGVYYNAACANATKAHCVAGYSGSVSGGINNIQEVTMATLGNASDFGDLTHASYYHKCASGAAA